MENLENTLKNRLFFTYNGNDMVYNVPLGDYIITKYNTNIIDNPQSLGIIDVRYIYKKINPLIHYLVSKSFAKETDRYRYIKTWLCVYLKKKRLR